MGFRIDTVRQIAIHDELRWEISFKGVEGRGEYATYYTGVGGKGLCTCEFKPGGFALLPVPNSERFCAPLGMAQEDVSSLVAMWMNPKGGAQRSISIIRQYREKWLVRFQVMMGQETYCWRSLPNLHSYWAGTKAKSLTYRL